MPLGSALTGLITLAVVVLASMLAGRLFSRLGQPTVLGPIVLGIGVGTTVTALPEAARSVLVPETSHFLLEAVGTAGLLLLMFSVGTELRGIGSSSGDARMSWRIVPSVLLPIGLCAVAAWPFADRFGVEGNPELYGWLFVGIALGVTAVPVLVTILRDLGIVSLPESRAALRIAIVTDGFAWILVTILVIASSDVTSISVPKLVAGAAVLVAVTVVLPRVARGATRLQQGSPLVVTMVVAGLGGASATQLLGFHPAIGAVIAGFCFPPGLGETSSHRTFTTVVNVLLPAFFVNAAMSVPLQALRDQASWGGLLAVVVVAVAAVVSKVAAGLLFGSLHTWSWRPAARLGVLLNCRGVTEIAIASVGFQAGLIGPFAFATLCGLAILTTAATAPLYHALADRTVLDLTSAGDGTSTGDDCPDRRGASNTR